MWVRSVGEIGEIVRDRRKRLGWSQQALAQRTGVSRRWVVGLEKGKPAAEFALVLRALTALGLGIDVRAPTVSASDETDLVRASERVQELARQGIAELRRLPSRALAHKTQTERKR